MKSTQAVMPPARTYAAEAGARLAVENNSVTHRNIGFVHTLPDTIRLAEVLGRALSEYGT